MAFDKIEGLVERSPVYMKGVVVGKVEAIDLMPDYRILVELEVDKNIYLTTQGFRVAIVRLNLFGERAIEVLPDSTLELVHPGDTLLGIVLDKDPLQSIDSMSFKIVNDSIFKKKI